MTLKDIKDIFKILYLGRKIKTFDTSSGKKVEGTVGIHTTNVNSIYKIGVFYSKPDSNTNWKWIVDQSVNQKWKILDGVDPNLKVGAFWLDDHNPFEISNGKCYCGLPAFISLYKVQCSNKDCKFGK